MAFYSGAIKTARRLATAGASWISPRISLPLLVFAINRYHQRVARAHGFELDRGAPLTSQELALLPGSALDALLKSGGPEVVRATTAMVATKANPLCAALMLARPSRRAKYMGLSGLACRGVIESEDPYLLVVPHIGPHQFLPLWLASNGRSVAVIVNGDIQSFRREYNMLASIAPMLPPDGVSFISSTDPWALVKCERVFRERRSLIWQPDALILPKRLTAKAQPMWVEMMGYRYPAVPAVIRSARRNEINIAVVGSRIRTKTPPLIEIFGHAIDTSDNPRLEETVARTYAVVSELIGDNIDQWGMLKYISEFEHLPRMS